MAFVWCPSINDPALDSAFYPGGSYVDWIGWDGYDRKQDPTMLDTQFQTPYFGFPFVGS